jgi:hypothetical protein
VLQEAARPADPLWSQPDAFISGWMYGSIDDTVLDLAMEPDQDAALCTSPLRLCSMRTRNLTPSSLNRSSTTYPRATSPSTLMPSR